MEYTAEFHQFLDKLEAETGHHNLIEAIREGYKVTHPLCEDVGDIVTTLIGTYLSYKIYKSIFFALLTPLGCGKRLIIPKIIDSITDHKDAYRLQLIKEVEKYSGRRISTMHLDEIRSTLISILEKCNYNNDLVYHDDASHAYYIDDNSLPGKRYFGDTNFKRNADYVYNSEKVKDGTLTTISNILVNLFTALILNNDAEINLGLNQLGQLQSWGGRWRNWTMA